MLIGYQVSKFHDSCHYKSANRLLTKKLSVTVPITFQCKTSD